MHHRICELHFKTEEVDKEFVHVLPDGNIEKLAKDRCSLRKGSVPSLFLENENSTIIRTPLALLTRGQGNQVVDSYKNVQNNEIMHGKFLKIIFFNGPVTVLLI